jgi:hypothetical protein
MRRRTLRNLRGLAPRGMPAAARHYQLIPDITMPSGLYPTAPADRLRLDGRLHCDRALTRSDLCSGITIGGKRLPGLPWRRVLRMATSAQKLALGNLRTGSRFRAYHGMGMPRLVHGVDRQQSRSENGTIPRWSFPRDAAKTLAREAAGDAGDAGASTPGFQRSQVCVPRVVYLNFARISRGLPAGDEGAVVRLSRGS